MLAGIVEAGASGARGCPADVDALAHGLLPFARDRHAAVAAGVCGRERVEKLFSLDAMFGSYRAPYDGMMTAGRHFSRRVPPD